MKAKEDLKQHQAGMIKALSILLTIAAVASTAAFLLYRVMSEKAYQKKWSDYDDCGVA